MLKKKVIATTAMNSLSNINRQTFYLRHGFRPWQGLTLGLMVSFLVSSSRCRNCLLLTSLIFIQPSMHSRGFSQPPPCFCPLVLKITWSLILASVSVARILYPLLFAFVINKEDWNKFCGFSRPLSTVYLLAHQIQQAIPKIRILNFSKIFSQSNCFWKNKQHF